MVSVLWFRPLQAVLAVANILSIFQFFAGDNFTDGDEGVVHMAMESATTGWVGVSFAADAASMFNADAVMGWINGDGTAEIGAWHVTSYDTISAAELAGSLTPSFAYDMAVTQQGGVTTICFSRKLNEPLSTVAPMLSSTEPTSMNWAVAENGRTNYQVGKG